MLRYGVIYVLIVSILLVSKNFYFFEGITIDLPYLPAFLITLHIAILAAFATFVKDKPPPEQAIPSEKIALDITAAISLACLFLAAALFLMRAWDLDFNFSEVYYDQDYAFWGVYLATHGWIVAQAVVLYRFKFSVISMISLILFLFVFGFVLERLTNTLIALAPIFAFIAFQLGKCLGNNYANIKNQIGNALQETALRDLMLWLALLLGPIIAYGCVYTVFGRLSTEYQMMRKLDPLQFNVDVGVNAAHFWCHLTYYLNWYNCQVTMREIVDPVQADVFDHVKGLAGGALGSATSLVAGAFKENFGSLIFLILANAAAIGYALSLIRKSFFAALIFSYLSQSVLAPGFFYFDGLFLASAAYLAFRLLNVILLRSLR